MAKLPEGVKLLRHVRDPIRERHGERSYDVLLDGQLIGSVERHASESWRKSGRLRTQKLGYRRYWTACLHFTVARQLGHASEPYVSLSYPIGGGPKELVFSGRTYHVGDDARADALAALVAAARPALLDLTPSALDVLARLDRGVGPGGGRANTLRYLVKRGLIERGPDGCWRRVA